MEKVIQEHLRRNITQFALIIDNIVVKIYGQEKFGYESEDESEDESLTYTFHLNNGGPVKYNHEIINDVVKQYKKETIFRGSIYAGARYDETLVKYEEAYREITLTTKYGIIVWLTNGKLSYEIVNLRDNDRIINYHSNKITHIENDSIIVIYDLEEYFKLRKSRELPFENGYTSEDLDLILEGDVDLAHREGEVIAYINKNKKIVMVGCSNRVNCSEKIFYEYLVGKRDVKQLITELENMRKNPRSYESELLYSLGEHI